MADTVLFAYRQPELPPDSYMSGRPELFHMLRELDVRPVVSVGAEAAFADDAVTVRDGETAAGQPDEEMHVAVDSIGVAINRINRSVKAARVSQKVMALPWINQNTVRSKVWRKEEVYDQVFAPLGMSVPTARVEDTERVAAIVEIGDEFVIKPRNGNDGKGARRVSKDDLITEIEKSKESGIEEIIQPALDVTTPFPNYLKPYDKDAASAEKFAAFLTSDDVKELRMYSFYTPSQTEIFPVVRSMTDGTEWLYVDPDSLPATLYDRTEQSITKLAEVAGAAAVFGTVDFGFSAYNGEAPNWHAIEINAKGPYMIAYREHFEVAKRLRQLFAQQIQATISGHYRSLTNTEQERA